MEQMEQLKLILGAVYNICIMYIIYVICIIYIYLSVLSVLSVFNQGTVKIDELFYLFYCSGGFG